MTILQLLAHARQYPIFGIEDCQKWFTKTTRGTLLLQLTVYTKRGHFLRLKRGLYVLNAEPFPDPRAITSRLDPRAIVSLETVLHAHGMIPDVPFATTAVTPGKPVRYHIPSLGNFLFRHVKRDLMFGGTLVAFPPYHVRIAEPEKALLDLFWFHRFERDVRDYLHELRLTLPRSFSRSRFLRYARAYHSSQLLKIAALTLRRL